VVGLVGDRHRPGRTGVFDVGVTGGRPAGRLDQQIAAVTVLSRTIHENGSFADGLAV
jgi:hypothetical protein